MKISQTQLREAAQILYPEEWKRDSSAALVMALKYLHEASFNFETRPAPRHAARKTKPSPRIEHTNDDLPRSGLIVDLENHLKQKEIHVTAAAKAIGINAVTLYSWFHGHSNPKAENLAKIQAFLNKTA